MSSDQKNQAEVELVCRVKGRCILGEELHEVSGGGDNAHWQAKMAWLNSVSADLSLMGCTGLCQVEECNWTKDEPNRGVIVVFNVFVCCYM